MNKLNYDMRHYFLLLAITFTCISCSTDSTTGNGLTDVDGHEYETVVIGGQEWMAENLRTRHYRNGTEIPNVPKDNWREIRSGAWISFDELSSNDEIYGKIYNGYAVMDSRGLCPDDWRLPKIEDWEELFNYIGFEDLNKLKATPPLWDGTDDYGFTAIPAGRLTNTARSAGDQNWRFIDSGLHAYWWAEASSNISEAWGQYMKFQEVDVESLNDHFSEIEPFDLIRSGSLKIYGYYVRCIRD